jgi:CDP-diacylglycerol--glycerol-3-phosphate 3-phosphatidyltransferase
MGLMPNTMTILGLLGNTAGAFFLAQGQMLAGGLLILAMGPVDALDGTMARLRGEPTRFGAFVDSVTDRYSELAIFAGLLFYYLLQGDMLACGWFTPRQRISADIARSSAGESRGTAQSGLLTRLERFLVLVSVDYDGPCRSSGLSLFLPT